MNNLKELSEIAKQITKNLRYSFDCYIEEGSFKATFRIIDSSGLPLALKIYKPENCNLCRVNREIEAMLKCDSKYLSKLYHFNQIKINDVDYYFSVEKFFDGGTLTNRLTETASDLHKTKKYALCLAEAILHLKDNDLVHRDIKPDNIMFRSDDDAPVLIDLGLVRNLMLKSLTNTWIPQGPGTPIFSSPEQLNNDKPLIDWRSDQFSLGLVIGYMTLGRHAFERNPKNQQEIVDIIAKRDSISDKFKKDIDAIGFSSVLKMLDPWPVNRYCSSQSLMIALQNIQIKEK